jgi:hypothetical protein
MRIIFSCSVYFLIVYISCIMQHVNSILILCFQKNYENLCPKHERPSFGLSCGYSIYMAKAVLEYFVRLVVINSLQISFQMVLPTVLTTNRGIAMIMWRDCNWYNFLVFVKCFAYFFKFGNKQLLLGHNHLEFSYACFWLTFIATNPLGHRWPGFGPSGEYFILVFRGQIRYKNQRHEK